MIEPIQLQLKAPVKVCKDTSYDRNGEIKSFRICSLCDANSTSERRLYNAFHEVSSIPFNQNHTEILSFEIDQGLIIEGYHGCRTTNNGSDGPRNKPTSTAKSESVENMPDLFIILIRNVYLLNDI